MNHPEHRYENDRSRLVRFETATNSPSEFQAVQSIQAMINQFKIPVLTNEIKVEDGARPHSHPVLTLNSGERPPEPWLELFTHEQMHWFFDTDKNKRDSFVKFAQSVYTDRGDCNTAVNPISFWEHMCVIWNTVSILRSQLEEPHVQWIFGSPQRGYPLTHQLVFDEFDKIGIDLHNHGLVYDLTELR